MVLRVKAVFLMLASLTLLSAAAQAQDGTTGMIGVYLQEHDYGGVQIVGFVPNTPASRLSVRGEIQRGDVVVKLAGKPTDTVRDFVRARNSIPFGKEGRMVLRNPRYNYYYYVWVKRKEPIAARAYGAAPAAAADDITYGGRGTGDAAGDIRDAGGAGRPDADGGFRPAPRDDDFGNPDIR